MRKRSSQTEEVVDVKGEVEGETDRAYRFNDGTRVVWLPKSQCEWDVGAAEMTMPLWLARDKELI